MAQVEHGMSDLVPLNTLLVPVALAKAFGLPGFSEPAVVPAAAPTRTDSQPRSQQQRSTRSMGQPTTSGQQHGRTGCGYGAHHHAKVAQQPAPSTTQTTGFGALELSSMNPAPQAQHAPKDTGGSGAEQPVQTTVTAPPPETSYQQGPNGQVGGVSVRSMSNPGMQYPPGMQLQSMQYPYNPQQLMAAAQAQAYHHMQQQIGSSSAMSYGSQGPGMTYTPYPGYPMMGAGYMMDYSGYRGGPMGMSHATMGATTSVTTEEEEDAGGARAVKRPRLVWTPQLHKRFEEAINKLGWDKAVPKNIMQEMNVEGLTRENVASHLQKYRLQVQMKKGSDDGKGGDDMMMPPAHSSPNTGTNTDPSHDP